MGDWQPVDLAALAVGEPESAGCPISRRLAMSKRFKMMWTTVAALVCGSLLNGCALDGAGRIILGILNEELFG